MKFIHLSDLHIGKRINNYSMIEDQKYIFNQILSIIHNEKPDALIIAGDIYDRSLPPTEAVTELDDFIVHLADESFDTFIISGNHDSAVRLAFGSRIMSKSGIHISPVYNGTVEPYSLTDEYGTVNVYLLPFIKAFQVKDIFPERKDEINTNTEAIKIAIENMNVDVSKRNIIVCHQFVAGASKSESEVVFVGGSDNVDSSVFEPFDYTALGHIHTPQCIGGNKTIRYCGTPLKYSFSEDKAKSVTVAELFEKGRIEIREIPLVPLRDMRTIKGEFDELYTQGLHDPNKDDYIRVILTDLYEIDQAMSKLKRVYPNIMELIYEKNKNRIFSDSTVSEESVSKNPLDLFDDFFKTRVNRNMNDNEKAYIKSIIEEIEEEDNASD